MLEERLCAMKPQNYDYRIAGARTFWILRFKKGEEAETLSKKPAVDFLIPSPLGHNQWMVALDQSSLDILGSLGHIQQICDDIRKECQQEVKEPEEFIDKAKKVSADLSTLDVWLRRFKEIMKRFKNLPPEEKR
jgi:hypothetical protein